MTGAGQIRLVAGRELRERSRSAAFRASILLMVAGVAAAVLIPSLISGSRTKNVGMAGTAGVAPAALSQAIEGQAKAIGGSVRVRLYDTVAAGETAVRGGKVDVLVVDASRLEWRRAVDEQLKAVVAGAIQVVSIQQRAAIAGVSQQTLSDLLAPVRVTDVELGKVAGRSPDDETATLILTLLLFWAITMYGAMVMSGVVEEKSSRVVEVLLARMRARDLLAGKIAGIGLLGLAQIGITAIVALVASSTVGSFNVPAVRGAVIAWAVVWFVLGYALYATVFGVLGSLASRTEDTQSVAGPVTGVLIAGYFVSFATVGSPDALWARLLSFFPPFTPFAMPNRIAMGGAAWWEPPVAAAVTLAAIAGLVALGGRIYTAAILHNGPTLRLSEAWRGAHPAPAPAPAPGVTSSAAGAATAAVDSAAGKRSELLIGSMLVTAAVALAAGIFAATSDFIIGLTVGAAFYAVAFRAVKARRHAHP